jgi:hypothetical protein
MPKGQSACAILVTQNNKILNAGLRLGCRGEQALSGDVGGSGRGALWHCQRKAAQSRGTAREG